MPVSRLRPGDLRDVRQALLMHNFLDIPLAIKLFRPDPRLGRLLLERISQIEVAEGRRALRR